MDVHQQCFFSYVLFLLVYVDSEQFADAFSMNSLHTGALETLPCYVNKKHNSGSIMFLSKRICCCSNFLRDRVVCRG